MVMTALTIEERRALRGLAQTHKEAINEFNRTELRLILEGLDIVRERMREELAREQQYETGGLRIVGGEEYNRLVLLQNRIIDALELTFY